MEFAVIAARWAVFAALRSASDGLNESWAASSQLGANVRDLQMELLYVQWMLDDVYGRGVRSPHLEQMMLELHHHAYDASNLLDELEYFRIQDKLEGTDETGDPDARGLVGGLLLNCRHTARAVVRKLKLPSCSSSAFVCGHHIIREQKLKLDRVAMSKRVVEITDRLKPVCVKVSAILNYEILATIASGSTISATQKHKPTYSTASYITEPRLYGRDAVKNNVVDDITHGKYCANNLTVLSIVGPGGIGKTALTQHIYQEVKSHFQVSVWICVSRDFNANRLAQIITKQIPKVDHEKGFESVEELIEKRLKSKRLLLVLDDMWTDHQDEWKKLLAPFMKAETKGNMVIVTTRIPKVAQMVTTADCPIRLERLNDEECMCFLKACVLGEKETWDGYLHDVGWQIVKRLRGFPLAVKIIGSLLKTKLTLDHWVRILESREWEYLTSEDDIMPALKLSYKHLPLHLQQCFSYCALFPEDYEFGTEEIIHLWIGLGLLGPDDQNKRIEDTGLAYLCDLVTHGFFQIANKVDGHNYYYIHDLFHDLPKTVSAYECLRIRGSDVRSCRSVQIPRSVRHISITIENSDVQDKTTFENCKRGLVALGKRLKVGNLSTLMLFGHHHGSFYKLFGDIFQEAKDLRVIFLSGASYDVKDLLPSFPQLVHLRFLRIKGYVLNGSGLFSSISRFYHLLVLDLKECKNFYSTEHMCVSIREMSNLLKIRHFLVPNDSYHSKIFEVGRLESIQELRRFKVKSEKYGFELSQLGQLLQLQGSLEIHNLERVEETIEVNDIELPQLHGLNRLVLEWDKNRPNRNSWKEQHVLECLKPPRYLQEMQIIGHGGDTFPCWLCTDDFIKNLECLCLVDVAWTSLPPLLGEFSMVGENLKRLQLVNIANLKLWSANSPFPKLEELIVDGCSELTELPVSHMFPNLKRLKLAKLAVSYMFPILKNLELANIETQEEWSSNSSFSKLEKLIVDRCPELIELAHPDMFPNLQEMDISECERLMSVPPIPWTSALCEARVMGVGAHISRIYYKKDSQKVEASFKNNTLDYDLCNVLDFSKLSEIRDLSISGCPTLPLDHLRLLKSLKILHIGVSSNVLWPAEGENNSQFRFPVEELKISSHSTTKEFARLISYFPNLLKLSLWRYHIKQEGVQETEAPGEGHIQIHELLQNQSSLISLSIEGCKEEACSISFPSSCHPLLSSLQSLSLERVKFNTFELDGPLTNLVELSLNECEGLGSEDLWHFLSQGHLKKLIIIGNYNVFDVPEPSRMGGQDLPHSSRPQADEIEGETRTVRVPTGQTFPSSLADLTLCNNGHMKHFTDEQSEALQMLTSLQFLYISGYSSLQALPEGLTQLCSLKTLKIDKCSSIRSLQKGTLPDSLTKLEVDGCRAFRSLPKNSLPMSLTELTITNCPAIRSLHVGSLPSSLGRLDVRWSNEKLQRQCEKLLRGTIPIVEIDYNRS